MALKNEEKQKRADAKIQQLRRDQEEQKAKDLADELGFPYLNLRISAIDDEALNISDEIESKNANAAIILKKQKELFVAIADPRLKQTKSFIKNLEDKNYQVKINIVSESGLEKAWERYKFAQPKKVEIIEKIEISTSELEKIQTSINTVQDLKKELEQPNIPTTQLLNIIMAAGLKLEASDIHFETEAGNTTRLRYRLDGILQDAADISTASYQLLLSRIKMLSKLKINIHDVPQDGRFSFNSKDKEIEIRTSIIPADNGENVVLRILDPKTIGLKLEDLGIQNFDYKVIVDELKKPNGMIITTGPTGSGKTTLLYAFLKAVNDPGSKIITLEDPVEYHLEGIEQTQVEAEKGYTFASGLRSILRQDPDIILIGEIRDAETATTAINAALTGHLVFSTLHTNDAAGAIPRLVDMKVNQTMIPPALNLIIAQRLIRKVCSKCSIDIKPDTEILEKIKNGLAELPSRVPKPKLDDIKIKKASEQGCAYCNNTGYKGRIGVFELFIIDDAMEKIILKTPSNVEIKESAIKSGMVLMRQDGLLKVLQGITTMEEVERILG
ncbi:GspE/PulE family protein [Patescibacteria group bacterium]|nr:GspE/PulE family protein [Patescibacteria group bacterium]MBU4458783.1 GspE/PulE family protein [Patescibacteria group bacterium]MCG2696413.1 GspE/PulE family protein [Candidatus Portnoybacteria bacterium]